MEKWNQMQVLGTQYLAPCQCAKRHACVIPQAAMTSVINIQVTCPDVWLNLLQHLTRCTRRTRLMNMAKKLNLPETDVLNTQVLCSYLNLQYFLSNV